MANDPFGFGNTTNAVTSRPSDGRAFTSADTYGKDCSSPTAQDGTAITAEQLNEILGNLRALLRVNGNLAGGSPVVAEDHSDAMLATALQQALQRGQPSYAVDVGSANAIIANPTPAVLELKAGLRLRVKLANDISGPATLSASALGAVAIKRPGGASTAKFDGRAGQICDFEYDGAAWQIKSPLIGLQASCFDQSVSTSAGGTLTAASCGATIQLSPATAGSPVLLPLSLTCTNGARLEFFHNGVAGQVLEVQGSDIIAMANGISLSQITLNTGDTLVLESTGASGEWLAVGGSAQIGYAAAFSKSLTASGYQKLPGGLILQWGAASLASGTNSVAVTLPIAFPNAVLAKGANDNGASNFAYGATGTTTQITVTVQPYYVNGSGTVIARAIPAGCSWWAIGY